MVLEEPWAQKRMFWTFEKDIFLFFADFWVTHLKPFSGKVRQSVQKYLHQNLVIGTFLENDFEATLSPKANFFLAFKKDLFQFFRYCWVTKVEPFFGKAKQCCKNFFDKVYFVESSLEHAFKSLFDHSK